MIITSSVATKWSKENENILKPTKKDSRSTRYANTKLLDAYMGKYLFENDNDYDLEVLLNNLEKMKDYSAVLTQNPDGEEITITKQPLIIR